MVRLIQKQKELYASKDPIPKYRKGKGLHNIHVVGNSKVTVNNMHILYGVRKIIFPRTEKLEAENLST